MVAKPHPTHFSFSRANPPRVYPLYTREMHIAPTSSSTSNVYLLRKYQLKANSLIVSPHGDGTSAFPALATGCRR